MKRLNISHQCQQTMKYVVFISFHSIQSNYDSAIDGCCNGAETESYGLSFGSFCYKPHKFIEVATTANGMRFRMGLLNDSNLSHILNNCFCLFRCKRHQLCIHCDGSHYRLDIGREGKIDNLPNFWYLVKRPMLQAKPNADMFFMKLFHVSQQFSFM